MDPIKNRGCTQVFVKGKQFLLLIILLQLQLDKVL
jgi:hypothetical protein